MMRTEPLFTRQGGGSLDTVIGMLLCTWLALTASLIGRNIPHSLGLLVLPVPCAGLVARIWGIVGGLLGLVCSAWVFCTALLAPFGRPDVASADARTAIFWMVLCGGVAAYVFARPRHAQSEPHSGGKPH